MSDPPISRCRICGCAKLHDVFSVGTIALSDFVKQGSKEIFAPLDLVMCDPKEGCALVQLKHPAVSPESMYRQYWYKSGTNQTMRDALADITQCAEQLVPLKASDVV